MSFTTNEIVLLIALVAWFVRLEAKVLNIEKEQTDSKGEKAKMWEKIEYVQKSVTEIMLTLTRIETKLDIEEQRNEKNI